MKRAIVPLVLLLLALLGGGVAYWKSRAGKPVAHAGADAGGPAVAVKPEKPAPVGESSGPPADLAVRYDDDPKGALRLEGQVVDAEERPVGGARVAISSNPPREVVSEADGSFAFDALLARSYSLEARKDDGYGGPTTVQLTAKTEPVILRLHEAASLEITVLDAQSKKPIAGAQVESRGISTFTVPTGKDGKALLRGLDGGWTVVKVTAAGYAPAMQLFQLSRQPGTHDAQTVLLTHGVAVAGRVVDHAGKPVAGAHVLAVSASSMFDLQNEREDGVESDAQGRWKIAGVAPGSWRFTASHEDFAPGTSAPVTIEALRVPREVTITLDAGATLAGEVRGSDGSPVPYANVRSAPKGGGGDFGGARATSCDEHGRFEIKGLARRELNVLASADSGSSDIVVVDLRATGEKLDLVLVLSQDGSIAGTVSTSKGEPLAEAQVFALPDFLGDSDDDQMTRWRLLGGVSDVTDQAGGFRLTGLPKGKYRLWAMRSAGNARDPSVWQRKSTEAQTGDASVKLVLEDDASVKGKVAYADGSVPDMFAVGTSQFGQPTQFSSKDGSFVLEGVAPGPRMLTVSGPGFTRKTTDAIEIKAGGETDAGTITVERGRTVRGRVVDQAGQPVAGAHVSAGVRLFGDGQSMGGGAFANVGNSKSDDSDEDGRFEIAGIGVKPVLVVADLDDKGRSVITPVGAGTADVELTLPLLAPGSIEGTVTSGGTAVPEAVLIAQPMAAPRNQLIVKAGADGQFKYDRLSPDHYLLSAMRTGSMMGGELTVAEIDVAPGKTTKVSIDIPKTDLVLVVKCEGEGGVAIDNAIVIVGSGTLQAANLEQIEATLAARGAGSTRQGMILKGAPGASTKFTNMTPGRYSLCVTPIQGSFNDPAVVDRVQKDPDSLPVYCKPIVVAESPNEQTVTATVPAPH